MLLRDCSPGPLLTSGITDKIYESSCKLDLKSLMLRRAPDLLEKKYKPLNKSWTPKPLAFQKKVSSNAFLRGFMLPAYIKDVLSMRCFPRNLDDGTATTGFR